MNIIEQYICGKKGNDALCEDGIVVRENLIVIIDGVTAKGVPDSGIVARKTLCDFFSEVSEQMTVCELLELANKQLRPYSNVPMENIPRASVIIYNDIYKEIWSYGDCRCSINGICHLHEKEIDLINSALRAFYLEHALLEGHTLEELSCNDIGRKAIMQNLKMQTLFENKKCPFGYPVLNGGDINLEMTNIYKIQDGDEVILASDGYPKLLPTLYESEQYLKHTINADPLCFRENRSTKGLTNDVISFDDRCYCRFVV